MARQKKAMMKPNWLTEEDENWVVESRQQMAMERRLWTDDADQFYQKYSGQWVAIRDGKVVHSAKDDEKFLAWVDEHDPERKRFLIRQVPNAEADFAF